MEKLLVYTQVFLSIALPVSMAPLIYLTSSKKWMGEFVNSKAMSVTGWLCAAVLIVLNLKLIQETAGMLFS